MYSLSQETMAVIMGLLEQVQNKMQDVCPLMASVKALFLDII